MQSRKIEYTHDGTRYIGELFWDHSQSGARPGVVVFPEAFGLNDHARERAARLAGLGYIALAADPHGDGKLYDSMESLGPVMQGLFEDRAKWRGLARTTLDALAEQPEVDNARLAAIGFCFGGATCLELARSGAPLKAIATFHAGLLAEQEGDAGQLTASVLICNGAEDPLLKKETIDAVKDEFRRDQVDWQFIDYGNAVHSFTDPDADTRGIPGLAYNARTEARSWLAMRNFFEEVL